MPGAHRESALPGLLALRLAALAVGDLTDEDGDEPVGGDAGDGPSARKRKAAAPPRAHWGLPSDSAARLSLIALSRQLRSQDEMALTQVAGSPLGEAFLAALRAAVLRVAVAAGGADAGLNETSVATLFNLSGSSFDRQARYDGASLTLPSRLPWANAKALVRALLDSLAASLMTPDGSAFMRLLLAVPFTPHNAEAQATMKRLIATVEIELTTRLTRLQSGGSGAASSSSSSSTWSAQQQAGPPPPPVLPMPLAPPQPQQPLPPPAPPLLDVSMSLLSNARRLVQARLGRPMTQPESEALDAGLVEALGVLKVGTDEEQRAALQLVALTVLSTPAGAQLWACLLTEAERTIPSVAEYATAVVGAASAIASAQLTAALGL